jgi:hypothetical protein
MAINEVHKQVEVINAHHADGLEVLQKEHATEVLRMRCLVEATDTNAESHSKKFNALVEKTTQEVKSKEREVESTHAELHAMEDSLKLICADLLGMNHSRFFSLV